MGVWFTRRTKNYKNKGSRDKSKRQSLTIPLSQANILANTGKGKEKYYIVAKDK